MFNEPGRASTPSPSHLSKSSRRTLNVSLVVDYQNVHLTAHDLFTDGHESTHKSLLHPLHFANSVISARNSGLKPGFPHGALHTVTCFRGQPLPRFDPEMHRRTAAQRSSWEKSDPRVKVVYRPLKYVTRKTGYSTTHGTTYEVESVTEKGIDVLCATAVLTEALRPEIDLVILASQDTDLAPCLDAALALKRAKIETVQWWNPGSGRTVGHLQPLSGERIWNTRLSEEHFLRSLDRITY